MNNHPLFAASIDPSAADPREPFERARIADENGLDLITIMDHPYNARLFDTWTLLTAIGQATRNIHLATNVASFPLRPPALLAKQAATLDILTEGRMELGLGGRIVLGWDLALRWSQPQPGRGLSGIRGCVAHHARHVR